jgi:hypothetical protein
VGSKIIPFATKAMNDKERTMQKVFLNSEISLAFGGWNAIPKKALE